MRTKSRSWATTLFLSFLVLAFSVRLGFLFAASGSPIGQLVILDSKIYLNRAEEILAGQLLPKEVFRMSPLYPYFLAASFATLGKANVNVARLWQSVLGALTCALVFLLADRLCGRKPAIAASMLYLFCGPAVFTDSLILAESLLAFLHLSFFLALVIAWQRRSAVVMWVAGLLLGLAAATRGNVLIYVPVVVVWALWEQKESVVRAARSVILPFLLGVAVPVGLCTAANYSAEHDFVLLSSNAGYNFYVGNHSKASGVFDKIRGHDESRGFDPLKDPDGRDFARAIAGRHLSPSEASWFWFKSALRSIEGNWRHFVSVSVKKLLLFFNIQEIPQIYSYDLAKGDIALLRFLPVCFGMVAPFGLLGLWLFFRQGGLRRLVALLCALYVVSICAFFVVGRYRMGLLPVFVIVSGFAILHLARVFRSGRLSSKVGHGVALGLLSLVAFHPLRMHTPLTIYKHFGGLYASVNEFEAARILARKALKLAPQDPEVLFLLGKIAHATGDLTSAARWYARAVDADPGNSEYLLCEAAVQRRLGRLGEARDAVSRSLRLAPGRLAGLLLAAQIEEEAGDLRSALNALQEAVRLHPLDAVAHLRLGLFYARRGKLSAARESLQTAASIAPNLDEIQKALRSVDALLKQRSGGVGRPGRTAGRGPLPQP